MSLDQWIFYSLFWVRLGPSHSSCKFLRSFRFAVFLHSSCSVVVSYFMLIPVFVICCFSVTVFQPSFGRINFYGRNQSKACATLFVKYESGLCVWSIVMSSDAVDVNLSNSAGKRGQPIERTIKCTCS